jgi:hypothetical protein
MMTAYLICPSVSISTSVTVCFAQEAAPIQEFLNINNNFDPILLK